MHDGSGSSRSKTVSSSVALYLRVSTEEQRERQSIDTQREFGAKYTDLHQLRVHRIYPDDGISGTVPLEKRPEGQRILQAARRGEFNQLLVYKLDRLGRDTRLILNAVAELEKYGVRVRSMTEEFDTATATGRLMLTMLSGFAAHERDMIRERSMAGTDRLARAGAWLGGIVPYGYRKEGEDKEARIVISEEEIPGVGISEADVIRRIYRLAANERATCVRIADFLNMLHVPCAYARDGRLLLRGKRKQKTSGLWRAGRIRNMLINATYMGRHEYGKRSKVQRPTIVREVPAIVDEATWQKAQQVLKSNFLFGIRSNKHLYLLRGMAKCGLCGLTFIGTHAIRPSGKVDSYYRCNGKHATRGIYGKDGERCPAKDVNGIFLEDAIWSDIEEFLRNPGEVAEILRQKIAARAHDRGPEFDRRSLEIALETKAQERDRVLGLFRKGRINETALDAQLDEIQAEEQSLRARLEMASHIEPAQDIAALANVEEMLTNLREKLDAGITWDSKRQLVEVLVDGITVDTVGVGAAKQAIVNVRYKFVSSLHTCTDTGSCRKAT
ncbi:MAG: recombinase family protein [Bryobacteraceae bacterium]|jgi:site-specific DNA recombinase